MKQRKKVKWSSVTEISPAFSYIFVLSLFWLTLTVKAQFFNPSYNTYQNSYYQNSDSINQKGVCTINGDVYYGIDCWCYNSVVGTTFATVSIVTLVICFLINGCIWACIFVCCKRITGKKNDDIELDAASIRSGKSSIRKRY
ncbi:CLUMA_CG008911, isoform A [Clunio marinus]|uniref:CLUMA_CG008911, isoform A n=1 Tax=Clunio marinus TaxID=568069 RepID=A0A1J1I5G7_9DIPT|nr:CLUMA_CG008911, isoform A [Clunio marinus]